jgi:hypothetical protein
VAEPETTRETTDVGAEASGEALRREGNFELRKDHLFSGRVSIFRAPAIVERKALKADVRRFSVAVTGVMIAFLESNRGRAFGLFPLQFVTDSAGLTIHCR